MLRVISEVRPAWVIGENVAGITSMELNTLSSKVESKTLDRHPECDYFNYVLSREANMLLDGICEDLEQIGYEVQPLVIPACGIDARHKSIAKIDDAAIGGDIDIDVGAMNLESMIALAKIDMGHAVVVRGVLVRDDDTGNIDASQPQGFLVVAQVLQCNGPGA